MSCQNCPNYLKLENEHNGSVKTSHYCKSLSVNNVLYADAERRVRQNSLLDETQILKEVEILRNLYLIVRSGSGINNPDQERLEGCDYHERPIRKV